jgi:hypothetical protein
MSRRAVSTVDSRRVDRALFVFYALVALVALAGQAGAAVQWLHWTLPFALGAVGAVEFGGIVLSGYSDHRRGLGERAVFARTLSAAVAAGAVVVNWLGHHDHLQGGFFAGMSALGYLVWLLHSGARRRDQLRAAGHLPPVAPAYGLWQWLRHPGLTRRARSLALASITEANPDGLGLYGSLTAAREQARIERRQAAIAALLHNKLTAGRDALAGEIAVTVYDLDEIAARLSAAADYDGLARLLAVDLEPARIAEAPAKDAGANAGADAMAPAVSTAPDAPPDTPPDVSPNASPDTEPRRPRKRAGDTPSDRTSKGVPTATKVAKLRAKDPGITQAEVARRLKVSLRTAARHWSTTGLPPPGNGGPVPVAAVTSSADMPVTDVTAAAPN